MVFGEHGGVGSLKGLSIVFLKNMECKFSKRIVFHTIEGIVFSSPHSFTSRTVRRWTCCIIPGRVYCVKQEMGGILIFKYGSMFLFMMFGSIASHFLTVLVIGKLRG